MCFTVGSGPRPTGTQTKTLRRRLFIVKHIECEKSKMKSRRKTSLFFAQISGRPQRNGHPRSVRGAGEEEETIYIRSSMEEGGGIEIQRKFLRCPTYETRTDARTDGRLKGL